MKYIKTYLASMKLTGILMIIIALACTAGTFIENDFGTETAKAIVYNALWFELVIALTALNLAASIYRYRMWKKDKITILTFHVSFIVIIIGSGLTRYAGYEGTMHIRESETSSSILSDRTYVQAEVDSGGNVFREDKEIFLSPLSYNSFHLKPQKDVSINYKDYYQYALETIQSSPEGRPAVVLVVSSGGSPDEFTLYSGESYDAGPFVLDFASGSSFTKPAIQIKIENDNFFFRSPLPVAFMQMADQKSGKFSAGTWNPLSGGKLHSANGVSFVVRDTRKNAVDAVVKSKQKTSLSAVIVTVVSDGKSQDVALTGTKGAVGQLKQITIGDKIIKLRYGSKIIDLPFSLHLTDFIIERYPGSNSPSSYESSVMLVDPEQNINEPRRIYMNHILVHRGLRFYQSSFDPDEKGTVLSVAKDPGMIPTYIGYFLMTFGFLINLFNRKTRFGRLSGQVAKGGN